MKRGMRYITALSLLMVLCFNAVAQQDSLVSFFNEEGKKVEDGPDVFYYRKALWKDGLWHVRDYYKKNNALKSTGTYAVQDSIGNGSFVYYYDNGQKEKEGIYVNGEREGEWRGWYENGNKWYIGKFREGYKVDNYDIWYKEGGILARLHYLNDIAACKASEKTDSTGKKIEVEGMYSGTCLYYHTNGKLASREEWQEKPISVEYWNEAGNKVNPDKDSLGDYVFMVLPKFDGDVIQFLSKNAKYPRKSRSEGEEGRSLVRFVVGKSGEVTDVKIWKTSGFTLIDEEAMRLAKLMDGKWTPGRDHNIPVRVYYTLPVTFRLSQAK